MNTNDGILLCYTFEFVSSRGLSDLLFRICVSSLLCRSAGYYVLRTWTMDLAIALLIVLPDPNEIVRACNAFPTGCEIYRHECEAHVSNLMAWVQ